MGLLRHMLQQSHLLKQRKIGISDRRYPVIMGAPIVNAIIGEKATLCEMNDIAFRADIHLEKPDGISKNHLCSIFFNLLDNAIKETVKLDDVSARHIEIKAAQKHSVILISCKNPVPGNIENCKLDPQKSSGYGLKILSDIAIRYDGSFDIDITDGICTAVIAVVTDIIDT